ncbi:MAG: acyl-CoA dehydrogenase family protein [Dehalococcoidia bacterium]
MTTFDPAEIATLASAFADRETVDSETYPDVNVAELKARRLLGAAFSPALGGRGWTLPEAVRAIEAVAAGSPSTALIWAMPLGLSGVYALGPDAALSLHRAPGAAQIEEVAARFSAGELFAACNSERGAGGSLAATTTVSRRDEDGVFHLTGEKILATSGTRAQHFFSTAKATAEDLPGTGVVEFFFVRTDAPGVEVMDDWDGFGMRSTQSQSVRYTAAPAWALLGFPNFIEVVQPIQYWYCLFAAVPLGCARGMIEELSRPVPQSPAIRLRLADATMRYEALRAYLLETASGWRAAAGPQYAARVLRTKTYVSQEATRLCAELFALGGGRHYRRTGRVARLLADSFAGTALRPPLPLALEQLTEQFGPAFED